MKAFTDVFRLCAVKPGEVVAILSETQTRPILPQLSELALHQLEARPFQIVVSSPELTGSGADSLDRHLARGRRARTCHRARSPSSGMVVDCTVEGMLHSRELPQILAGGARADDDQQRASRGAGTDEAERPNCVRGFAAEWSC